jgi:hypothetical protein
MRDAILRQKISERFQYDGRVQKLVFLIFPFVLGIIFSYPIYAANTTSVTDNDIAKLAELAACSTGQTASAIWLEAKRGQSWLRTGNAEVAKRLLVDISIDTCAVRHTSNRYGYDREIGALSPANRYN